MIIDAPVTFRDGLGGGHEAAQHGFHVAPSNETVAECVDQSRPANAPGVGLDVLVRREEALRELELSDDSKGIRLTAVRTVRAAVDGPFLYDLLLRERPGKPARRRVVGRGGEDSTDSD